MKGTILIGERVGLSHCAGSSFVIRYTKPSEKGNKIILELIPKGISIIEMVFLFEDLTEYERKCVYELKETLLKNVYIKVTPLTQLN